MAPLNTMQKLLVVAFEQKSPAKAKGWSIGGFRR